jgi:hypothetical protein
MKNTYVNSVPLAHGELTIVMSKNADEIRKHSCSLADSIRKVGVGTILINCGISEQRFREDAPKPDVKLARAEDGEPELEFMNKSEKAHLLLHTSVRGELVDDMEYFNRVIHECQIGVIIIAGWEWASSSWRKKERLLYRLRELMADTDVAVIVYSMNPTVPVAGELTRGSVGRLSTIALAVTNISVSQKIEAIAPKPPPIVTTQAEIEKAERSAQLLANKINEIQITQGEDLKPPVKSVQLRGIDLRKLKVKK